MIRLKHVLLLLSFACVHSIRSMDQQEKIKDSIDQCIKLLKEKPLDKDKIAYFLQESNRYLCLAAALGQQDVCKELLDAGVHVDSIMGPHMPLTALCYAAMRGNSDVVQLLLDHGADSEAGSGPHGTPPLIAAALALQKPIVTLLMERAFFLPPALEIEQAHTKVEQVTSSDVQRLESLSSNSQKHTTLVDVFCTLNRLRQMYPHCLPQNIISLIFEATIRADEALKAQACERVLDSARSPSKCPCPSFLVPLVAEKMVPFVLEVLSRVKDEAHHHLSNDYVLAFLVNAPRFLGGEDFVQPAEDTIKSMFELGMINQEVLRKNIAARLVKHYLRLL